MKATVPYIEQKFEEFNRYPNSSALKVHFLEADEINKQLVGAEKMACDGKSIRRNQ